MTLSALVDACHPIPSLAVTAVAGGFALAAGRGPGGTALVAATILASQLGIGWQNDFVDRGRDRSAGRLDKPIATGRVSAATVGWASAGATACFLVLLAPQDADVALIAIAAAAAAGAYNLWAKRTVVSPLPYAVSFGLLPVFVTVGDAGGRWPPAWIVAGAALLGVAAHFANVLPDLEADRRTGVWGLPQRLGRGPSTALAAAGLAAASVVLAVGPRGPPDPFAAVATTVALTGASFVLVFGRSPDRTRSRVAFLAVVGVAAIDVVMLIASGTAGA